jgi:bifunctional non-homologous end joining protein LigD
MARTPSSAAMKLAKYRTKRDFKKTTEPSGVKTSGKIRNSYLINSYLIQKHAARRLHYDFRLEMDGVLKSWAVTRGPSLNPEDKRLAVHVEDHPVDYGDFEGTIPHGQYGGGTVMLWDNGTWEPIGDVEKSYKKGNLTFELHGKRLKGRWHLVRMHGRKKGDEKHENWLLIKGKDQYANTDGDYAINHYQKSVTSQRSMEKIAVGDKVWQSGKAVKAKEPKTPKPKKTKKQAKGPAAPDFVPLQLATLVSEPPQGGKWVHEIKFDGYRLLARLHNGDVTLMTRARNDWTAKFKSIASEIAELGTANALLDGEIVSTADDGTMSFHGLQNALSTGKSDRLNYYIFDLLYLNGVDLRDRPLLERKKALQSLLKNAPSHIHYSEHFAEPGAKVLSHACHIALEGIISKRADAAYHSGRGDTWLKSKCTKEQEIVIGGYTMQPKHPGSLGALLMGYYSNGDFIFAGKVGTGFTNDEGRAILKKLKTLERKASPFKAVPTASKRGAVWVQPKLVAQIHFAEWTPDGHMRHPSFQGLREDKPAQEVRQEKAKPMQAVIKAKAAKSNGKEEVAGVTLSHPDKKLYPDTNITKRDLALYYEKIAPLMLPHVANRPISLMRCPEGEGKPCFFQRHGSENLSPYIKPVKVAGHGDNQPFLMIQDLRGLVALVQAGALEIHIWGTEAANPEKPDRLVFDLDPAPDVKFSEVKKAALEVRERLRKLKLVSFLKTTGGKGLHIVVPFQKGPDWDTAKAFARGFAQIMVEDAPDRFTINNRKDVRKGKIYIDYLRNGIGASAIAPYSTRARNGAPVALPLDWKELAALKSGHDFQMKDTIKRIKKNPWKSMLRIKQTLPVKQGRLPNRVYR